MAIVSSGDILKSLGCAGCLPSTHLFHPSGFMSAAQGSLAIELMCFLPSYPPTTMNLVFHNSIPHEDAFVISKQVCGPYCLYNPIGTEATPISFSTLFLCPSLFVFPFFLALLYSFLSISIYCPVCSRDSELK